MSVVKAEMVLEISRLQRNAKEAEESLRRVGRTGATAATQMNAGFGLRSVLGRGPGREVSDVRQELEGLGRSGRMVQQLAGPPLGWLARTLTGIAAAGGAAGTALSAVVAIDAVKQAGAFERSALEIERFAGSAEMARKILQEIDDLAVRTPFETSSVEGVAKGLLTAGVQAERVMEVVRDLAAVAGDDETLGRLGNALGVGFASQKFELDRVKQFLESQINLVPALADVMGTDSGGVFDAISKGKVGFDEMAAALKAMSQQGGQFFGLMEARSKDLNGQWSTLTGNLDMLLRRMGQPALDPLTAALDELNNGRLPAMVGLADAFGERMEQAGEAVLGLATNFEKIQWGTAWEDFITAGLAAGWIVAKGIGEEIDKALGKVVAESPLGGAEALGKRHAASWQGLFGGEAPKGESDALKKAREQFEASAARDRRENLQHMSDAPRGPGESRADRAVAVRQAQEDRLLYSPETMALRRLMLDLQRAEETAKGNTPPPGVKGALERLDLSRTKEQSEGATEFVRQTANQFLAGLDQARIYGRREMAELPKEDRPPVPSADVGGLQKALQMAEAAAATEAATAAASPAAGSVAVSPEPAPGSGGGRYAVSGDLRSLVNAVSGRGGPELLYVEASRQTELLGAAVRELRDIRREMAVPQTVTVPAPGRFSER